MLTAFDDHAWGAKHTIESVENEDLRPTGLKRIPSGPKRITTASQFPFSKLNDPFRYRISLQRAANVTALSVTAHLVGGSSWNVLMNSYNTFFSKYYNLQSVHFELCRYVEYLSNCVTQLNSKIIEIALFCRHQYSIFKSMVSKSRWGHFIRCCFNLYGTEMHRIVAAHASHASWPLH